MLVEHILILALCGLGVFHGVSLGAFLSFFSKPKELSNQLLGILLLVFGLRISKSIFLYFTSDLDFQLITLGLSLTLSFGPLFFFYVQSFLDKDIQFKKKYIWHFLPFSIFMLLNGFGLLEKDFYLNFGIYFIYGHFLAYIIASFLWQKKVLKESGVNIDLSKRKWLIIIHIGMIFIWASYFMFLLDEIVPYILGPITYSLVIYPLSWWALTHKVLVPAKQKYKGSRLDNEASNKLIRQLTLLMEKERLYLNTDLKLAELAAQLNTTPHGLSQAVNENFKQNFQQYINHLRVKAAETMLIAPEHENLTISAIAYECGFNSLSTFNSAFKKKLNKTPSQFRKENQQ